MAALGMPGALTKLMQAVGQGLAPSLWVSPGLGADAGNPADRKRKPSYLTIQRVFAATVFLVAAAIAVVVLVRYWPSKQRGAPAPVAAISENRSRCCRLRTRTRLYQKDFGLVYVKVDLPLKSSD